jgi:hypothetical protein
LLQYLHKGNQTYAELELDSLQNFERLSKTTIVSMVTCLSKPFDHNEPFELESDNKTAEVKIDWQLSMKEKLARAIDKEINSKNPVPESRFRKKLSDTASYTSDFPLLVLLVNSVSLRL